MNIEQVCEPTKESRPLFLLRDSVIDYKIQLSKHHLGIMLTMIDASISDEKQRQAIKDLITQSIWNEKYYTRDFLIDIAKWSETHCKDISLKTKDLEEEFIKA